MLAEFQGSMKHPCCVPLMVILGPLTKPTGFSPPGFTLLTSSNPTHPSPTSASKPHLELTVNYISTLVAPSTEGIKFNTQSHSTLIFSQLQAGSQGTQGSEGGRRCGMAERQCQVLTAALSSSLVLPLIAHQPRTRFYVRYFSNVILIEQV